MKITFAILISLGFPFSAAIHAEEAANTLKIEEVKNPDNQPKGEDIDTIITNNKMRAETGSKSKYSISTSIGYNGGSLHRPLDTYRPNITKGTRSTDVSTLGAQIHGKYAIDTANAILAGTGVRMIAPQEGSRLPKDYSGDKYDV